MDPVMLGAVPSAVTYVGISLGVYVLLVTIALVWIHAATKRPTPRCYHRPTLVPHKHPPTIRHTTTRDRTSKP